MTIAEKLTTIAENEQKVHDAGYDKGVADQKAVSVDWDIIQNKGNRQHWPNAFAYWGYGDINPKYMIKPTSATGANAMFQGSYVERVDWSKFDFSECVTFYTAFNSCPFLVSIDVDLTPTADTANVWGYYCSGAQKLKRIQKMVTKLTHAYQNSFTNCKELEEIRFAPYDADAGIGIGNDISFADSPNLTRESIVSILEALSNELSTTKTLTFNTDLFFESKMKDYVFGFGSNNVMESREGTINGLEYRLTSDEIYLNGTSTDDIHINLCNTPIVFPEWNYSMSVQFFDEYAGLNDWLSFTVQKADGSTETVCAYYSQGYSIGGYEPGDTITSIDLDIPAGQTYNGYMGRVCLLIDYLYWIEETLLYRTCWNIVY